MLGSIWVVYFIFINQNELGKIDQVSESQMYAAQYGLKYFLKEYLNFNENSFLLNI